MNANSAKNPTSSSSTPTETISAPPATRKVVINGDEEVVVGADTEERFFTEEPDPVNDSVFKCADCKIGTVHQGYEFTALHVDGGELNRRRIYMCTNCGKFSTK